MTSVEKLAELAVSQGFDFRQKVPGSPEHEIGKAQFIRTMERLTSAVAQALEKDGLPEADVLPTVETLLTEASERTGLPVPLVTFLLDEPDDETERHPVLETLDRCLNALTTATPEELADVPPELVRQLLELTEKVQRAIGQSDDDEPGNDFRVVSEDDDA